MSIVGCASSSNTANLNTIQAPSTLRPVASSTVAQGTLPAIGTTGAPAPGLSGQPVLGGVQAQPMGGYNTVPAGSTGLPPIGSSVQTANLNGGMAPMAQPGTVTGGPEGVWTVLAGTSQCRLNLPLTVKEGTSRYRASAPGCALPGLATVASWQQVGNQVQIFDENNTMVAAVAQSGGRYIGTLAGGQGISMQR
ncbi:AprI/Inh family metalloprotease inhibitor [uncultured Devosia sp.]|uniref:AprI/Inh family metalloprotease inhibitor n=1 Tax=uncultured Devosia sp. TaxID=211434 RepID=UPI0035CBEF6F